MKLLPEKNYCQVCKVAEPKELVALYNDRRYDSIKTAHCFCQECFYNIADEKTIGCILYEWDKTTMQDYIRKDCIYCDYKKSKNESKIIIDFISSDPYWAKHPDKNNPHFGLRTLRTFSACHYCYAAFIGIKLL